MVISTPIEIDLIANFLRLMILVVNFGKIIVSCKIRKPLKVKDCLVYF